jgi:hypothetical protein
VSAADETAPPAVPIEVPPVGVTNPRTWRIEFPPGMELLTSNQQGGKWQKQYRITKPIKDAAIVLARAAKIPHLNRVTIVAEFRPPTGRRRVVREVHNLGPSAKAAIDGLVKAGVLTDDSDRYVADVSFKPGDPHPLGQLVLLITELPEDPETSP